MAQEGGDNSGKTNYFDFREVLTYFFRKKDPNRPSSFNLKAMHTINKISMLMFLICLIVMIVRIFTRT
ncbi:MAG: DUF6728 family protein [Bacteroidota bacterium]